MGMGGMSFNSKIRVNKEQPDKHFNILCMYLGSDFIDNDY